MTQARPTREKPNDKKFRELVLYIARKSEGDSRFGATKLNKLLFYSDFYAFGRYGKSITGHPYQVLKKGPAPKLLPRIRQKLIEKEELAIQEVLYFGKKQQRPIALRDPELSVFSGEEIALVDDLIARFWNLNATEISEESHLFPGWIVSEEREEIPKETVFVSTRRLTPSEKAFGLELEASCGR